MAFQALERLINLEDGYRRVFRVGNRELLLLQIAGERLLIDRRCPHAGEFLDAGTIASGCITCPRHHFRFSLSSGEVLAGECPALRVYDLAYEGNSVGVDTVSLEPD